VAVLGPSVVEDLFEDLDVDEVIGKKIKINGIDFSIIGTTVAKGGSGFGSSDDIIFIRYQLLNNIFLEVNIFRL